METVQRFAELIKRLGKEEYDYLNKLFQNCPIEVIREMRYKKVKKGEAILHAGDPCKYVYIIMQGKASGFDFQMVGSIYMFKEYFESEILGDFELFGGIPKYRISVNALTDCELIMIPSEHYLRWMKQDINALFLRTSKLMNTLTDENAKERKYSFLECKDRMVIYLVGAYERNVPKGVYVLNKTQTELAERIGFNVRTIQRNIIWLQEKGFILVQKGKITISKKQYEKLKQYMEEYLLNE